MKTVLFTSSILVTILTASAGAAEPTKLAFDTYSGYFVSNQFEPDAPASFAVIDDQAGFDRVFGVAMVMGDKSHRLPKDAFKSHLILTAIKRGNASCEYKVEGVTVERGVIQLRYAVTSQPTPGASFACPLIVSAPRGTYQAVAFIEDGKKVNTLRIGGKTPKETP